MSSKFDSRQTELRSALSMVGSSAHATLDTILPAIDSELSKLFSDRNIHLADGGAITFSGSTLSFTEPLLLTIDNPIGSGNIPPVVVSLSATSRTLNNGDMLYATVNRTAGTATLSIATAASGMPGMSSANQDNFLIAKRQDSADGTATVYFREGTAILSGQTARLGAASGVSNVTSINTLTGAVTLAPGSNTNFSTSGNTITINAGLQNVVVTTDTTMVAGNSYIVNKSGSTALMALPATASVGDTIRIIGENSAGWAVTVSSSGSGTVYDQNDSRTGNVAGYILMESNGAYNTVELQCTTANTGWTVVYKNGPPILLPNYYGTGADGDVVISTNTTLTPPNIRSAYDADAIVKNYHNLTINSGATLTASQPCRGLILYLTGDLTINGTLSMGDGTTGKGAYANPATAIAASFTGVIPGTSTSVTLTAGNAGSSGNSIALAFTGSNNINSAISTWNTAHPTNTVSLSSGSGTQTPSAQTLNLAGGLDAVSGSGIIIRRFKSGATSSDASTGRFAGVGQAAALEEENQPAAVANSLVFAIPRVGGAKGTAATNGGSVTNGTGGGGGGGNSNFAGGVGSDGTCFAGGSGGGGGGTNNDSPAAGSGDAAPYAGLAGAGLGSIGSNRGQGGIGNPNGSSINPVSTSGNGGVIMLFVKGNVTIGSTGSILAQGSTINNPATEGGGGGASGGGAVVLLYAGNYANSGTISASGGLAGTTSVGTPGGSGGSGSVIVSQID